MKSSDDRKTNITFGVRYGYALGEFGFTFFLMFLSYYLLYFLTDVALFPAKTAAAIYSICQWIEVFTVLAIGVVIDKVRFKTCKYRPWLLIGSIACTLGCFLTFTKFNITNYALYGVVFGLCYTLAYVGYNAMWIAFRTLLGYLGRNSQDRVLLSTATAQLSTASALLFSYFGTKILLKFINVHGIYSIFSIGLGLIMIACMLIVSHIVKPYDKPHIEAEAETKEKIPFWQAVKNYMRCLTKPMIIFLLAISLRTAISTVISTLMVYYMRDVIGSTAGLTYYMIIVSGASLLGTVVLPILHKYMDKITVWNISSLCSAVVLLITYFFAKTTVSFMALLAVNQMCLAVSGALLPVFISDISVYNEKICGIDAHAFSFSFGALAIHFAQIIGSIVAAYGLVIIGYDAASGNTTQYASGISFILTICSAVMVAIALVIFRFYDLDEKKMKEIEAK